MNILFLGDIFAKQGREIVLNLLNDIKKQHSIDFTIANAENSAHGKGITLKIYNQLIENGIDCITLGNHAFSKSEIKSHTSNLKDLIFPINHIDTTSEQNYKIYEINSKKICVCNILCKAFMPKCSFDQISAMNKILSLTKDLNIDSYIVDLHGETTAEKRIFAEIFKDKLSLVAGTHTHIQTADEQILYNKTAFISDVGMCGPYYSIIGCDIETMVEKTLSNPLIKFEISSSDAILNAIVVEIDDQTTSAKNIKRIQIRPN